MQMYYKHIHNKYSPIGLIEGKAGIDGILAGRVNPPKGLGGIDGPFPGKVNPPCGFGGIEGPLAGKVIPP